VLNIYFHGEQIWHFLGVYNQFKMFFFGKDFSAQVVFSQVKLAIFGPQNLSQFIPLKELKCFLFS
jgi:hypothetical protein